jgi:hypothetical protein
LRRSKNLLGNDKVKAVQRAKPARVTWLRPVRFGGNCGLPWSLRWEDLFRYWKVNPSYHDHAITRMVLCINLGSGLMCSLNVWKIEASLNKDVWEYLAY